MRAEPNRDWLKEKEVLAWQPWMTHYLLRELERDGILKLKTGGDEPSGDIWRRRATTPRFYRTARLREMFCTNGNNTVKGGGHV